MKIGTVGPLDQAFFDRKDLLQRIYKASAISTELANLFADIAKHINTIKASPSANDAAEPSTKKRKLDVQVEDKASPWAEGTFSTFNDVSFSIPQRKKLKLEIGTGPKQGLRAKNANGEVESFAWWPEVSEIACLPVPEKPQAQYNFVILIKKYPQPDEQVLFTVPDMVPKAGTTKGVNAAEDASGTYKSILLSTLNRGLAQHGRGPVSEPSASEFSSQVPQAVRKGETAYHIKAFRGAKEGYLFLLSIGIIWGFKKPLEFFPFDIIESISYTSVLQRTFNLNITVKTSAVAETKEFEFSMVDQADFGGIDAYVKRHGLQDASMAEQRRAKKLNLDGVKKGEEEADGEGEGELQKAAREAEEDDDEEDDENFDPGSDGESEGEGSETDEDELANGQGQDDMDEGEE